MKHHTSKYLRAHTRVFICLIVFSAVTACAAIAASPLRTRLLGVIGKASAPPTAAHASSATNSAVATLQETDIGVTKQSNVDNAPADSNITYTITVINTGPDDAVNAAMNDTLPAGVTFVSLSTPAEWSCLTPAVGSGGTVACTNPSLSMTSGDVFTLVVHIESDVMPGTFISNKATVSSSTPDTNEENDSSTATVLVMGNTADIGASKLGSPDQVLADSDVTYTITVSNGGPNAAVNATLNDTLPGPMTFVSLSSPPGWGCTTPGVGAGGTVTCTNPSFAMNSGQVFTLVVHVPSGTPNSDITNTATVSSTTTDPNTENNIGSISTGVVSCFTSPVVTTNADSGAGSLRQAILTACAGGTIVFDMTQVVSPITLTSAELLVNKNLTIQGPGANVLTVRRSTAGGTPNFRIFNVADGWTVRISGLTISNGNGNGGGILNQGTLTLIGAAISGNSAPVFGGGVENDGENGTAALNIINSTISGNTAASSAAGILNFGFNGLATLNIINSTISGNTGPSFGGGIYNDGNSGNAALNITNSTISGNTAGSSGGGIYNFSNGGTGTVALGNTIVSDNKALNAANGPDIFSFNGTVSGNNNLIQTSPGSGYTISGSNNLHVDPLFEKDGMGNPILKFNGGPTQTHLLRPGSPAINAGANANLPPDTFDSDGDSDTVETLPVDQRGFARIINSTVDIGAVEANYAVSATAGTPQSTAVNSAFGTALQATITESGNAQSGVSVTFTAPASGASGTFPGNTTTANVITNASGVANAPTFTANSTGGSYNVVASIGTGLPTANFALTNTKLDQTITFNPNPLPDKIFGDPDFTVNATASSNLPVSFAASGNCTVTGTGTGTVHLTGAGSCTITASQGGDSTYNAAPSVQRPFNIAKAATTTAVSSSVNPSATGQNVTFTATVTSTAGTPTGTVQFKDGGANLGSPQTLNAGVATFATSTLTTGVHAITADYSGDVNFNVSTGTLPGGQTVGAVIRFSSATFNTTESSSAATITVKRDGDQSQTVTVDYATSDGAASLVPCSTAGGAASSRCDFTTALGTLKFAPSEDTRTFVVLISQDNYVEGAESLDLTLSNLTGAAAFSTPGATTATTTLTIDDDLVEPSTNPIDNAQNFVRQLYHDFLNREPDANGLAFWTAEITSCGANQQCIDAKRVNVAAAFYLSIEFQATGYLVERIYKASYGDASGTSTLGGMHQLPVPVIRLDEFLRDTQQIGQGLIVGQGAWETVLENNKQTFTAEFVQRARFLTAFPLSMTAAQFVDKLNTNAGNPLSTAERNQLVSDLGSNAKTRAQVLRAVAEDSDLRSAEFNRAFVLMEYLGFLRRNPNDAPDTDYTGYDFWLTKLIQFNGDFIQSDMVKGFITSTEYRRRFGQ